MLVSQIAADEQLLADGQFQSGAVEKRTGELIAEVEEMRTAAEDGIEQFVLEAGCKVQFRGVAAEKHHLYFGVRVGIDQSQLETVQLLLVVVYQTYLKAFGTDGYIQGRELHAGRRTACDIAQTGNLESFHIAAHHIQQSGHGDTGKITARYIGESRKLYAGSLFACNIQQASYNHSVAVIARDIGKAGEDHSPCVITCDAHKAGNGQTAEVIAVDIGDARYLYAPHASTHHVGYTGDLNSVHVSARNSSQNIYSQAVQTVHRREDTEIEECASDRICTLCGKILPKGKVDTGFFFMGRLLPACPGIACPCQ